MNPFVEHPVSEISGVISCFDRVVLTGTLPDIGHAEAMARYLSQQHTRLFDFLRWAEPFPHTLRRHAEELAAESGLEIEFIRRHNGFRKEERIKAIVAERGDHPGLAHIFSAMETCASYRPWHDRLENRTQLKSVTSKCLHYYFDFIDEVFGLCYLRVPTWAPFRLQVYFNGHHWLARRLENADITFQMRDNAFLNLANPEHAQRLADSLDARQLHRRLDPWAPTLLPDCAARFRRLSLELDAGGVRHRCHLPSASQVPTPL